MDDNDKQEILEHLKIMEENDHNAIETINKQIKINLHFNETIFDLKKLIEGDRDRILKVLNETDKTQKDIIYQQIILDQIVKIKIGRRQK